jgi:iron uptake system component EfeO
MFVYRVSEIKGHCLCFIIFDTSRNYCDNQINLIARRLLVGIALVLLVICFAGGCGSGSNGEDSEQSQAAIAKYKDFLNKSSAKLLHWAETIGLKVKDREFPEAGSRYAAARVPYGHVAPAAVQLFGPLNTRIDPLEREVPPDEYGGFHLIEKTVFWEETTISLGPVAKQLRLNIEELGRRLDAADIQPSQAIAGANKVLEGMTTNEVWGNAEPWSHTDLTDIAAKVEGVDAAFAAAKPALADKDQELATRIEAQLHKLFAKVGEYGTLAREPEQSRPQEPGIAFVVYDQLTQEERWDLAELIETLSAMFAEAEAELPVS